MFPFRLIIFSLSNQLQENRKSFINTQLMFQNLNSNIDLLMDTKRQDSPCSLALPRNKDLQAC